MSRRIFAGLLLVSVAMSLWPIAKNVLADFQLHRAPELEARLVQYAPKPQTLGPVTLSPEQRERLLRSLDWDYVIFGKGLRGYPMGLVFEVLEISPRGDGMRPILTLAPGTETNRFEGWIRTGGWNKGARKPWETLKAELFPRAPEAK